MDVNSKVLYMHSTCCKLQIILSIINICCLNFRFDDTTVTGTVVDSNRAICVQPFMMAEGYVRFEIATGVSKFNWKGKFFVGKCFQVIFKL
jgi:hypothetical protein